MLTKMMNRTFFEVENKGKRNNSNLAPSKTQQERCKIYNSGKGISNGPVKIKALWNNAGDSSNRGILVPKTNQEMQVNRTYDTRRGSKTGRKKVKVVSSLKQDARNRPKIMSYKTSLPKSEVSESQTLKEKAVTKTVADIKKVLPIDDTTDQSRDTISKKVRVKDPKPNKTEDKRDSNALKKLTEVHSFPRPPLPKLENTLDGWMGAEKQQQKEKAYSNDISMDDIMIGEMIGQGAYAVVKMGLYIPANLTIAIKIYEKSKLEEPQRRKSVKREIRLMGMMDNEFIVKLYGVIETRHQLFILMEYVSGLSLHGYLKLHRNRRLPEDEARRIYQQLMLGLKYWHKKCITHRDIKLENILLDENRNVKIIDFGFSTKIPNEQKVKMFWGTPSYMAPEIVTKQEYSGPPADIWASSVLLFALLWGYFPYKGATDAELYERICSWECYAPDFLSHEAKTFLNCIFQYDPDDRPSAEKTFNEPWMMLPINEKYSTASSTGISASKSASQSSDEVNIQAYQNKLFEKRKNKMKEAENTQPQDKIKSKLYVLSDSSKQK